jgi:hypothetical protein
MLVYATHRIVAGAAAEFALGEFGDVVETFAAGEFVLAGLADQIEEVGDLLRREDTAGRFHAVK